MGDEADAVPVEKGEDVLVVPALVAELDDLLEVLRQPGEEGVQPFQVLMEAWRQLVEQGPELVSERSAPGR